MMVEGHPKAKRLCRSISSGSGGISPDTSTTSNNTTPTPGGGVTSSSRSASVYSNLNLHLLTPTSTSSGFSSTVTTNFVVSPAITNVNFNPGPGSSSASSSTSNSVGGSTSPVTTPLVIQSGRKETRSILYQGIYQKFNRVFSAVNAFKMQKAKGSSVSGEYSRVATSSATVTPSTSAHNFQNLSGGK